MTNTVAVASGDDEGSYSFTDNFDISPIMYRLALDRTEEVVSYVKEKFINKIHSKGGANPFPGSWTLEFLQECDHAVNILVAAYLNRGECNLHIPFYLVKHHFPEKTVWLGEDYATSLTPKCTGRNELFERNLDNQYPPIHFPSKHVADPCTVTDSWGNSLVWYLPGILTERRQVSTFKMYCASESRSDDFAIIKNMLWNSLKDVQSSFSIDNSSSSMRVSPMYYRKSHKGLKPGNLSLSPAWFQQGHEVFFFQIFGNI